MKEAYLKASGVVLGILIGSPLVVYALLDVTQFEPRREEINAILQGEASEDLHPPPLVIQMLSVSERGDPSVYASRLLARELRAIPERTPSLEWHTRSVLWLSFVRLHLSEEKQTAIFLGLAPTEEQLRGFTATSVALYRRQPSELSAGEVATIIALMRQPSAKGEQLERIRTMLLARYEAGT